MSELSPAPGTAALLVGVLGRVYALPIAEVIETMRPLPIEPIAEGPAFVRGLSIVRGEAVPVVDLASLLDERAGPPAERWVLVRAGDRRVALAVERVIGLGRLEPGELTQLPPLLQEAHGERVRQVGRLDRQLLMVLEAARLAPEEPA